VATGREIGEFLAFSPAIFIMRRVPEPEIVRGVGDRCGRFGLAKLLGLSVPPYGLHPAGSFVVRNQFGVVGALQVRFLDPRSEFSNFFDCESHQIRPKSSKIRRTTSTTPTIPLGPHPYPCQPVGPLKVGAPAKSTITSKIIRTVSIRPISCA
jgi:hypothetical protein